MPRQFKVLSGGSGEHASNVVSPEEELTHFRNVNGSLVQGALDTWGDIWDEMQNSVVYGVLVTPEIDKGFKPKCGWPEFLERMWLLRRYLEHAKTLCEGQG
ncbi:hypothetical protein HZA56_07600 [Candidatus Poribacteria bacterium]|nr:hypothetical protein [Candidatus Poribacteria bacterium]